MFDARTCSPAGFTDRRARTTVRRVMFRPFASRAPHAARLQVELLEERAVPTGLFLTGVGGDTSPPEPFARIYSTTVPGQQAAPVGPGNINAFPGFGGSVRVASGDVNGDGIDDIICAQGPGAGS